MLFRFTILILSWFALLSCTSSPSYDLKKSQSSPVVAPTKTQKAALLMRNDTADHAVYSKYETYKPAKQAYQRQAQLPVYEPPQYSQIHSTQAVADFDFDNITHERFRNWLDADFDGQKKTQVNAYYKYLMQQVGYIPPMEQLLRSARSWLVCGFEPYGVPPEEYWQSMVDTLRLLKLLKEQAYLPEDFELVSVYRNAELNRCAKGSRGSKHIINAAVDIKIPYQDPSEREILEDNLCQFWHDQGAEHALGLGLYRSGTIHIDTQGHRTWGSTYGKRSSRCLDSKYTLK